MLRRLSKAAGFAVVGLLPLVTAAQTGAPAAPRIEFSGSGFLSAYAGKIVSGTAADASVDSGYRCPCFISDYAHGGVYERGAPSIRPDSRLGLQGSMYGADRRFGLTGQIVSRGAVDGAVNLEWLYATWEATPSWTVQVGRKRLPLFSYSEVQDVGFAIPWAHLPPQLYGWEIVNFNGASLTYRKSIGEWSLQSSLFAGGESLKDSGYWKIYNGKASRTDSRWSKIRGIEAKVARGPFELRLMHIASNQAYRVVSDGDPGYSDPTKQTFTGIGFAYDAGNLILRSEHLAIDRTAATGREWSHLFVAGYRLGRLTPYLSFNSYAQRMNDPTQLREGHATTSAVLRYDLSSSSALKFQVDRWRDRSDAGYPFIHGDSTLITLGYDQVF